MTPQDEEHLRLLAIFHKVVGGLGALFALFPAIHLAIGVGIVSGRLPADNPDEAWVGWFFIAFASLWIVAGLTMAACLFQAGRYLQQRRRYMFCLVVAVLACLLAPVGTVLGVFTIIVLMREPVRAAFGQPVGTGTVAPRA